jgi:hypothetical protein
VEKSPEYIGPTDYEVLLRNDVDSLDRLGDVIYTRNQAERRAERMSNGFPSEARGNDTPVVQRPEGSGRTYGWASSNEADAGGSPLIRV